jgi:hypothetical protein
MSAESEKPYDLEELTAVFGEKVIDIAKEVPRNEITRPLISQIVPVPLTQPLPANTPGNRRIRPAGRGTEKGHGMS